MLNRPPYRTRGLDHRITCNSSSIHIVSATVVISKCKTLKYLIKSAYSSGKVALSLRSESQENSEEEVAIMKVRELLTYIL